MAKKMNGGKGGRSSGTGRTANGFDQKLNTDKGIGLNSVLEKAATNPYKGYTPSVSSDPLVGNGGASPQTDSKTYDK